MIEEICTNKTRIADGSKAEVQKSKLIAVYFLDKIMLTNVLIVKY